MGLYEPGGGFVTQDTPNFHLIQYPNDTSGWLFTQSNPHLQCGDPPPNGNNNFAIGAGYWYTNDYGFALGY
jgi:hypothetical protein